MGGEFIGKWKAFPFWKKFWVAFVVCIALLWVISFFLPDSTPSKTGAYYKCLSKSKACSNDVPGAQLQFMAGCKNIYLWTSDNVTPLVEYTNKMC